MRSFTKIALKMENADGMPSVKLTKSSCFLRPTQCKRTLKPKFFELFLRATQTQMREDFMSKIVTFELDLNNPLPLTKTQKAELEALAKMPDSKIDFSEIPPLSENFRENATFGRYFKPVKASTTLRVDADVLAWLKSQGKSYQTRINAISRSAMLAAAQEKRQKHAN